MMMSAVKIMIIITARVYIILLYNIYIIEDNVPYYIIIQLLL